MEEEEAIIKGKIETEETYYLYKAETGFMNIIQTSDHGKCDIVCYLAKFWIWICSFVLFGQSTK